MTDKELENMIRVALRGLRVPREKPEWTKERHAAECARARTRLNCLFPGNELDLEPRKILIRKYQRIWDREQYPFGVPRNMIRLNKGS